jgi:two-component system phosphate regulon response regulator PhoB
MRTILLIEDERDIALLVRFTLENAGYRVLQAVTGSEGLQIAERESDIGLIILDIMMPGMDGYEVLRRFKSDPVRREIPVLIFSAMVQDRERDQAFRLGAAGFIRKPFDAAQMVREVERLLPNGRTPEKDPEASHG